MAFPSTPTNGQIAIVGGVAYQYATVTNSWVRISTTANVITANIITVDTLTANTLNVNNNLYNIAGNISATGNVTGNYILGNGSQLTGIAGGGGTSISNGTSNITIASSGGNAAVNIGGTASVAVFAVTGEYVTGVVSASGNVTGGNVLTGGLISATGTLSVTGATTLTTLSTGNISAGNVYSGGSITTGSLISATGNITGGNVVTGGLISTTGNVSSGASINTVNLSVSGNVLGNLLPSANITYNLGSPTQRWNTIYLAGNTIELGAQSISATATGVSLGTGDVSGGNITTTGLVSATGNVAAGNVNTSSIRPTSGALTISTASGAINLSPAGNVVLSANTWINNLAYPAQAADAATKEYVDNFATTAITYHQPVYVATTANLASTTSGTITYTQPNGAANGVGAKLTTTGTFNLIDTGNVQSIGTRILVKDEGNAVYNGVYTWANVTNIVRSTDTDEYGSDSTTSFSINDYFFTTNGNVNAGSAFIVSAPAGTITFGTSNITFSTFSSSQAYTANTAAGLSLTGSIFSTKTDNTTTAFDAGGNIIIKASAALTTPNIGAATGTSLNVTANVTGGNILTGGLISAAANVTANNGMFTTIVNTASYTGAVVSVSGNVTGGNLNTTGTLSTSGNVTANNGMFTNIVNVASHTGAVVSVTGNVTANNGMFTTSVNTASFTGAVVSVTGNVTANNGMFTNIVNTASYTGAVVSVTGNVTANNGIFTTSINTASFTGTTISVTGNVTANNGMFTNIVNVASHTGAVVSVTGNVTANNGMFTTIVNTASHTGAVVSVSGNVTGNYFIGNGSQLTGVTAGAPTSVVNGTSNVVVASSGNVTVGVAGTSNVAVFATTGEYVTGLISATGNVTANNGIFTNIVNVASHTGAVVSVTGNITGGNITIPGTANISTFIGNVFFGSVPAQPTYYTIAPLNLNNSLAAATKVQLNLINTGGGAGAGSAIDFYTYQISVAAANAEARIAGIDDGNYAAYLSLQTKTPGSTGTNGLVERVKVDSTGLSAVANITGGNINTGGLVSATANVTANNGMFTNIVNVASHTGAVVSVTGNITANNGMFTNIVNVASHTGAVVSVTGNVTANNGMFTNIVNVASHTGAVVSVTGNITGGNITGTLLTAAQTNITSVGTLSTLSASGNITGANVNTATTILSGSVLFNGTTQYLTLPNSSVPINISSGDFTVECWFNTNSILNGGLGQTLFFLGGNTSAYATVRLGLDTSGLIFYASADGTTYAINSGIIGVVASNTWYHVAVTRATNTFKVFLNGTQVGTSYTQSGSLYAGTLNYIGALNYSAIVTNPYRLMNGYISNMRVVKGVAVYTANFTPSINPLTSTQSANVNGTPTAAITGNSTGLLMNTVVGAGFLTDSSSYVLTVTNVAAATSDSASPTWTGTASGSVTSTYGIFATSVNTASFTGAVVSVTGNVTANNGMFTTIVNTASYTGAVVSVTGNVTGGNVTTAGVLTVNSGAAATAIVNGASNAVGNIGSSGTYFNRLFAQATTALYADLAEVYKSDAEYPPGTVLVFGGDQEVTVSTQSHDTRIAGVVSTNPAHVMNSGLVSEFTVEVGLIGRVPCQVIGPVAVGDRVVSSNRAGVAERLDMQHYQPGVIIGKAVESYNGTGVGTIEVVVGRL